MARNIIFVTMSSVISMQGRGNLNACIKSKFYYSESDHTHRILTDLAE
jgi:hypothetical protein